MLLNLAIVLMLHGLLFKKMDFETFINKRHTN